MSVTWVGRVGDQYGFSINEMGRGASIAFIYCPRECVFGGFYFFGWRGEFYRPLKDRIARGGRSWE